MLTRDDLMRTAQRHGIGLGLAEREYVTLCLLEALRHTQPLAKRLVFKGGTALRQVYFADWRYSQDLDFSSLAGLDTGQLGNAIEEWFVHVRERWGVLVTIRRFHRANGAARLRAQFVGPLAFPNRVLMDFTLDEPVLLPPVLRPVVTDLFKTPRPVVQTYALEELLAEKMRSILQRVKSRDYYDVWRLLTEKADSFDQALARETLLLKCRHKGITFSGPKDFLLPERLAEAGRYWERELQEQIDDLPDFQAVTAALRNALRDFLGHTHPPAGSEPAGG